MRYSKIVFGLLFLAGVVLAQNNGIQVTGVKLIRKGTPHIFQMTSPSEFNLNVSCTEDTGAVDIVFVLDTTGSMSSSIDRAVAHIVEFAETMAATGFDYSFGIVTYGDGFNFPHGYNLTTSVDTFVTWMGPIGSSGGGDTPEDALDAIAAAVDSIHWRPMALRVIILLTDACFCEPGSGCSDCHASHTSDEVATSLLDGGFMFFAVTRNPVYGGFCCDGTYSLWWYQHISDSTGGGWFDLSESFASIYHDIIGLLGTFQVVEVDVANFSGEDLDSLYAYISLGSCIELLYGSNPAVRAPFADGDTVSFFWRVNYTSGCTGPDGCFQVSLSDNSGTFSTVLSGCMYIPNCYCTPVVSGNISPEPGVWSACDPQPIQIGIYDDEGVDVNTIVFNLNGEEITYPDPSMEFDDSSGVLTVTPDSGLFHSGDTVEYGLVDAHDAAGCTLSTAASGWFLVDLDPPQFADEQPESGIIVGGIPRDISINISDEYSGVDTSSIILVINGTDTFTLEDSAMTYEDSVLHFNPTGIYDWAAGETVHVCVYAADRVSETYCGPNADQYCWDFVIDRLHLYFTDTTVYPDEHITYPLFAENPARFGFTTYWVNVQYNPAVLEIEDVVTTGTASGGFTVDWDTTGGILHIEASGASPIGSGSHLLDLELHVFPGLSGGAFTQMRVVDADFDSGRVGWFADDGLILVEWTQTQWVHDLEFWGYNGDGGYLTPTSLTIGCAFGATRGFDPEYDVIIPMPPPSQTEAFIKLDDPDYPAIRRLERSIQNSYELPDTWYIVTVEEPGSLYWSPLYFPPGIITLNGYIDMKRDSVYHYSANETLIIVYSQPDVGEGTVEGCPGWNLLSLPTAITVPGWAEMIDQIIFGPLEYDAASRRYVLEDPPRRGFGFWVFATDEFSAEIGGIPLDTVAIPVYRGWNLIGSVSDTATYTTDPPGIVLSGSLFGWDCETESYQPAAEIVPGKGYWIFCTSDGVLYLHP